MAADRARRNVSAPVNFNALASVMTIIFLLSSAVWAQLSPSAAPSSSATPSNDGMFVLTLASTPITIAVPSATSAASGFNSGVNGVMSVSPPSSSPVSPTSPGSGQPEQEDEDEEEAMIVECYLPESVLAQAYTCGSAVSSNFTLLWSPPQAGESTITFGAVFLTSGWISVGFGKGMVNGTALIVNGLNEAHVMTMPSKDPRTFVEEYGVIPLSDPLHPAEIRRFVDKGESYVYLTFSANVKNTLYPLDTGAPVDMIYAFSESATLNYHHRNRGRFRLDLSQMTAAPSSVPSASMEPTSGAR